MGLSGKSGWRCCASAWSAKRPACPARPDRVMTADSTETDGAAGTHSRCQREAIRKKATTLFPGTMTRREV